jgi:hypothetical protein
MTLSRCLPGPLLERGPFRVSPNRPFRFCTPALRRTDSNPTDRRRDHRFTFVIVERDKLVGTASPPTWTLDGAAFISSLFLFPTKARRIAAPCNSSALAVAAARLPAPLRDLRFRNRLNLSSHCLGVSATVTESNLVGLFDDQLRIVDRPQRLSPFKRQDP